MERKQRTPEPFTLEELLKARYRKPELKEICKENGGKGYSLFRVGELVEYTKELLLNRTRLEKYFLYISDDIFNEIRQIVESGGYGKLSYEAYEKLSFLEVVATYSDGYYGVASDFVDAFNQVINDEYLEKRGKCLWMKKVISWVGEMYIISSVEKAMDIFRLKYEVERVEFFDILSETETIASEIVIENDTIISMNTDVLGGIGEIRDFQGDSEFYMPTLKEVDELWHFGYLPRELKYINMHNWLREYQNLDDYQIDNILKEIWKEARTVNDMDNMQKLFDAYDIYFDGEEELFSFIEVFTAAFSNTRSGLCRGQKLKDVFSDQLETVKNLELMGKEIVGKLPNRTN